MFSYLGKLIENWAERHVLRGVGRGVQAVVEGEDGDRGELESLAALLGEEPRALSAGDETPRRGKK